MYICAVDKLYEICVPAQCLKCTHCLALQMKCECNVASKNYCMHASVDRRFLSPRKCVIITLKLYKRFLFDI